MIDVLNYTINGYPVLIYTLMFASAGILTYATVYSGASLGLSDSTGAPAAAAPAVAASPVAAPEVAPAPAQGGRRNRKSKRKQSRSKKNRSKHLRK
jgi:hypothetical protein